MRCWVSETPPARAGTFSVLVGVVVSLASLICTLCVLVVCGWCGCAAVGGVVVFENCTVDASIFLYCVFCKCVRAHGGCLGIESR